MGELRNIYASRNRLIDEKLKAFRRIWEQGGDECIFEELCYCLCTSREKAANALKAVAALKEKNLLLKGGAEKVAVVLKKSGIALYPQKAEKIILNRKIFYPGTKEKIHRQFLSLSSIFEARKELADQIPGIGLKEASHFLRNIGFGSETCILDTHVINQLLEYGVIPEKPKTLTRKRYYAIEAAMIHFAGKEGIPLDALDLVFMFKENPEISK
jgi:N-glycosylase/DNA lyase